MNRFFIAFLLLGAFSIPTFSHEFYHNVLSAVKDADAFQIIKVNTNHQVIAHYSLPHSSNPALEINNFSYLAPGTYILPLKKGSLLKYKQPDLSVEHPETTYSFLLKFKQLPIKDETEFLIGYLSTQQPSVRFAALRRLQENHFFDSSFDEKTIFFFKDFFTKAKLSVLEKRFLLENFAICNFNQLTELYIFALSDQSVAKLAGMIFYNKNQVLFSHIIKKYISNDSLWKVAIKQAKFFVDDVSFVNIAMKRFDYKSPQNNSADFIPLLFTNTKKNDKAQNEAIIKRLLMNSKNTKSFELYRTLAYWLNHSDPSNFREEIMQFLINNKKNPYIADGIIYPTMLSALRKSGHPQANMMLLKYLEDLKSRNNKPLTELVCILFKKKNQSNPTLDTLISNLK